jgi:ABC-type siderophore export system fused ATPase/permease subunit
MNICALLTRRNLALKRERRQRNVLQKRNEEKFQSKRDQQVLIMLFIQMMFYGITILPLMGIYFYSAITIYTNKSSDRLNIEQFITYLVEMINFLFPVCSFYLYTMASHMFRIELKTMLRSLFKCQLLENTIRVGPIIHEMQIRDKPEQLTTSLPIPQSFIIDREKFESKTEAIDHN